MLIITLTKRNNQQFERPVPAPEGILRKGIIFCVHKLAFPFPLQCCVLSRQSVQMNNIHVTLNEPGFW